MKGTTRIVLTGKLGTTFGREWNLVVSSPAEAIRAIDANVGGKLRRYLADQGDKKFYKVAVGKKENLLGKNEISGPSGSGTIYIMPSIKGRNSGFGKILAGIALVAIAFATQQYELLGPLTAGSFAASAVAVGYGLGASLILGGITQLLAPTPNFNQGTSDSNASKIFQGNSSAVAQGVAVGLIYGRALVTPMPIMIAYNNADQLIASDNPVGDVGISTGPGGVIQYPPSE